MIEVPRGPMVEYAPTDSVYSLRQLLDLEPFGKFFRAWNIEELLGVPCKGVVVLKLEFATRIGLQLSA